MDPIICHVILNQECVDHSIFLPRQRFSIPPLSRQNETENRIKKIMTETYINGPSIPNEIGENVTKKRQIIADARITIFRYLDDSREGKLAKRLHILPIRILNHRNLLGASFALTPDLSNISRSSRSYFFDITTHTIVLLDIICKILYSETPIIHTYMIYGPLDNFIHLANHQTKALSIMTSLILAINGYHRSSYCTAVNKILVSFS